MKVYRVSETSPTGYESIFDIKEATYTGQDMSKRCVTATIKYPTPIDFKLGDYIEIPMQDLFRNGNNKGSLIMEKFYIYTEPQCKKTARPLSAGDAFETTVVFYPRQFELSGIQMRDFIQQEANAEKIIYTGFDTVSFYGGAHELLERCMACLAQHYKDDQGHPLWTYVLADEVNEDKNNALERYAFSFSQNSVMDALLKLNDKDGINTTFFINDRTIYVGFKRPFLCKTDVNGEIENTPLQMTYGKTSHLPLNENQGGLHDITKSVGEDLPITKLFAYGAARNLNRYYCSDRIKSGRYVNKLMLPSFSDDGMTDWIISEEGVAKYGIREGSKTFEEIYPSLRYMTYADIRGIRYCIQVKTSGLESDQFNNGIMDHTNDESRAKIPLARVQCYKVVPCTGDKIGRNQLVECAPPEDLAVFIHATGKTVKVLLMGDDGGVSPVQGMSRSVYRQYQHDFGKVPTRTYGGTDYIEGACFAVHDNGFDDMDGTQHSQADRQSWFNQEFRRFSDTDSIYPENITQQEAELHRIEYVDTFWMTDLYVMEYRNGAPLYDDQRSFKRDGYSAWAWPRLNNESGYSDALPVNEVVAVEPVVIADTSDNINGGRQQHFDIYLRDLGFAIDEQNDFGEMVFVFDTPKISVLDGILAGREFTIDGGDNLNDFQDRVVCAYKSDGSFNDDFLFAGDSKDEGIPQRALMNGAVWRIRLNRNDQDSELSSIGLVIPNVDIQMKAGDHIVLLDIYMPDIYIHAAENRLLREARAYLSENDKSNVKYAVSFDKVRFNQIPNYAKQLREGLMVRMYDEDLNMTSENTERAIYNPATPAISEVPLYAMNSESDLRTETRTYAYATKIDKENKMCYSTELPISEYDSVNGRLHIQLARTDSQALYVAGSLVIEVWGDSPVIPTNQSALNLDDRWAISFDCTEALYDKIQRANNVLIEIQETIPYTTSEKEYYEEDMPLPAICKQYINFKSGKFYEVVMQVEADRWSTNNKRIMLSTSPISTTTHYEVPSGEYECEVGEPIDGYRQVKYSFHLPDSFNDAQGYYVALQYIAPDNSGSSPVDFAYIRMVSVTEKDLNAAGSVVKYVDFTIQNVNIKFIGDGSIQEISAQLEEQTKATSWGALMNEVAKSKIEVEQNKRNYELLAEAARKNYQSLLNLKNNIFDPDGNCTDLFIQTMMLQVGADSMNYQLEQTLTLADGAMNNFSVAKRGGSGNTYFSVANDDVLHHFVYTQGGQGGNWVIPGSFEKELVAIDGTYPVYYVAIKCKRDTDNSPTEVAWVCDTEQHAVNEDNDYWYFNWGILTPEGNNGTYSFMETRGNAYMYGDNIVAGKISTIAGNSFFDLTHGNFVLSKYGPVNGQYHEGMTYINGVLTIYGSGGTDRLAEMDDRMDNMQTQIDNNINSWFYSGEPTMSNQPVTDWENQGESFDNHLGDLYYDNNTGYCYRFYKEGDTFGWMKIVDNDVVEALRKAVENKEAIDNVTNDKIISKGSEKLNLKKEWLEIAGANGLGTVNGTYYKAKSEADAYKLGYSNMTSAFTALKTAMETILGSNDSNVGNDTYLSDYSGTLPSGASTLNMTRGAFNELWRVYYQEELATINKVGLVVNGSRNYFAKKFMEDWNSVAPTNLFPKAKIMDSWTTGVVVDGVRQYEYDLSNGIFNSLRSKNTSANSNYFHVRKMIAEYSTYGSDIVSNVTSTGQFSGSFQKTSDWHYLQLIFNGNVTDARMAIDADDLFKDGHTYYITGKVTMLDRRNNGTGNYGRVEQIYIYDTTEYNGVIYKDEYVTRIDSDNYGEKYVVHPQRLRSLIGEGNNFADILQGNVTFEEGKQYTLKVKWKPNEATSYNTLYLGFKYADGNGNSVIQCPVGQSAPITQWLVSEEGRTVVGIYSTYNSNGYTAIYDISLTEGAKVPDGWMIADEDVIRGGMNLAKYHTSTTEYMDKVDNGFRATIKDSRNLFRLQIDTYNYYWQYDFDSYVVVDNPPIGHNEYTFRLKRATKYFRVKHNGQSHDIISSFTLDELIPAGTQVVVSFDLVNRTQGSLEWRNVMIQIGNRATDYVEYHPYIAEAFENIAKHQNVTEIEGGLVSTSLLKLRHWDGTYDDAYQTKKHYVVKAGMSGLDDYKKSSNNQGELVDNPVSEGVTLWSGGDYADALAAAAGGTPLPILLTKTGFGSMIGCFYVVDENTIKVKTGTSEIFISNKSVDELAQVEETHSGNGLSNSVSLSSLGESTSGTIWATKSINVEGGKYSIHVPAISLHMSGFVNGGTRAGGAARVSGSYTLRLRITHGNTVIYESASIQDQFSLPAYQAGESRKYPETGNESVKTIPEYDSPNEIELSGGAITFSLIGGYTASTENMGSSSGNPTGSVMFFSDQVRMTIRNMSKYVVVAKDGMGIIANSDSAFYVQNNGASGDLKLIAKGLPKQTTTAGLETGQIYNSNGTLKINS